MKDYLPIVDSDMVNTHYENLSSEEIENEIRCKICRHIFIGLTPTFPLGFVPLFDLLFLIPNIMTLKFKELYQLHKNYLKIKQTDDTQYIYTCYMTEMNDLIEKDPEEVRKVIRTILKIDGEKKIISSNCFLINESQRTKLKEAI